MKKRFIFWIGSVIAVLLLLCASAGAALAENGQPSKSAAEWQEEGYTVVDISDGDATGFIVLRKDVAYLKDGITRSENTFTLSGSTRTIQEETPRNKEGEAPLYCLSCGGKLWFGTKGKGSNGNTLVLDNMISQEMGATPVSAAPYLTDTWIDTGWQEFEKSIVVEILPLYAHGRVRFYIDHTSVDPGADEPTRHYFHVSADCELYSFGVKSDQPYTGTASVGIYGYKSIHVVSAHLELDNYTGEIDWYGSGHLGFQFEIDTMYIAAWFVSCSEDSDNHIDFGKNNITATGDAALELAVGPEISAPFPLMPDVALYLAFGVAMESTPETERYVPPNTKASWHECEQCLQEDLYTRDGPIRAQITFPWDDDPTTIIDTGYKDITKFFTWYYSSTYGEFGVGTCPHFGYRTDVTLTDQHKKPLEKFLVHYYPEPDERLKPMSEEYTGPDGKATVYMPVSGSDPTLLIVQALSPANPEYLIQYTFKIHKKAQADDLEYEIIIPEKTVRFYNSVSGETTDWPENIVFSPFYSRDVTLPNNIPCLPGRIFTGWNTARDGSGTSYTPGTTLVLEDHLDLWAQWELAGDSWYVIYNANGGTKAPAPQIVTRGRNAVLSMELPECGKLIFKGWTPDRQKLQPVYRPGDILPYDSGKDYVVLYAMWDLSPVPEPIHISFQANGVEEAYIPQDVWLEQGRWLTLEPAVPPLGSAYVFKGWSDDPHAAEPEYAAGQAYHFYRNTTLYARWSIDPVGRPVIVTFNANGGSPESVPPACSAAKSVKYRLPLKEPSWDPQHHFLGWSTDPNASRAAWKPGNVVSFEEDTVLYAVWKAQYRVISGAGTVWTKGSGKTQRFVADGDLKYFSELRIDGRPFDNWVKISSGSTVADISAKAMETLSVGDHTVTFVYVDGEASASFSVRRKLPPTGDRSDPALWLLLIVLGIAGLTMAGIRARTEKKKR